MQNVKTAIKAVAATAVGALMLGTTLAGAAMAADLGSLPQPFVGSDGTWDSTIVVGSTAATADVVGALQIAAAFGQKTVQMTEGGAAGTVDLEVSGAQGKTEDIKLGWPLDDSSAFGTTLKQNKLPMLSDTEVSGATNGEAYGVHEEFIFDATQKVRTALYEDGAKVVLDVPGNALKHSIQFEKSLDANSDTELNSTDFALIGDLEIPFLGKVLTIKNIDTTSTPQVTLEMGTTNVLSVGDSTTYGDYTVTLSQVDTSGNTARASVSVTGSGCTDSGIINEGSQKYFCGNGVQVKLVSAISGSAEILVGEKVSKTLSTGDDWLDNDDYIVTVQDNVRPYIYVTYAPDTAMTQESGVDIGESLPLLYDKIEVYPKAFITDTFGDFKIKAENNWGGYACSDAVTKAQNLAVARITFPTDAEVYVAGTVPASTSTAMLSGIGADADAEYGAGTKVKELYLYMADVDAATPRTIYAAVKDDDSNVYCASNYTVDATAPAVDVADIAEVHYGDTYIYITPGLNSSLGTYVAFNFATADAPTTEVDEIAALLTGTTTISRVGTATAVATDVAYANADNTNNAWGATASLGTKEKTWISAFGTKVLTPKTKVENSQGSVELQVPNERQKVTTIVGKEANVLKTLAVDETYSGVTLKEINMEGASAATVEPIAVEVAKLDTEVTNKNGNFVLVGGPSVNKLVSELGMTAADFGSDAAPVAKIKMFEDAFGNDGAMALVVAGWEAPQTRAGTWVVAHYDEYMTELDGKTEVTVQGTGTVGLDVA
jgi:hypothetical protein